MKCILLWKLDSIQMVWKWLFLNPMFPLKTLLWIEVSFFSFSVTKIQIQVCSCNKNGCSNWKDLFGDIYNRLKWHNVTFLIIIFWFLWHSNFRENKIKQKYFIDSLIEILFLMVVTWAWGIFLMMQDILYIKTISSNSVFLC